MNLTQAPRPPLQTPTTIIGIFIHTALHSLTDPLVRFGMRAGPHRSFLSLGKTQLGNSRKEAAAGISEALAAEQRDLLARLGPGKADEKPPPSDISIAEGRFNSDDNPPSVATAQLALKIEYSKARLIDAATGKTVGSPLYHGEERLITCHAFSPDGKRVTTGTGKISSAWTRGDESGDEGDVRVWDTATGNLLGSKSFRYYVTGIAFLPDGKTVRVQTDPVNGR